MTSLIVDASVGAKWFVEEPGSEVARGLGGGGRGLIAPEIVVAEIGSALWKRVQRGALEASLAIPLMKNVALAFDQLYPLAPLGSRAFEIACALKHPVYDCFYFALAEKMRLPLVSADAKLIAAAARLGTIDARSLR